MGNTYTNQINSREVSLGIEHLLIAPQGTSWTPARIDVDSPPAGFTHLGAVVEDSASVTNSREKFQLKTGLPRGIQYEAVLDAEGRLELVLFSISPRKAQYAFGNVAPVNMFTGTSVEISTAFSNTVVTLASAYGTQLYPGDYLILDVQSNSLNSSNEAVIATIADSVTLNLSTPYPTTPTTSMYATQLAGVRNAAGMATIRRHSIIGVGDFVDGYQVLHYFADVTASSEVPEVVSAADVGKMQLAFDARVYTSTIYNGKVENLTMERFWIPPNNS